MASDGREVEEFKEDETLNPNCGFRGKGPAMRACRGPWGLQCYDFGSVQGFRAQEIVLCQVTWPHRCLADCCSGLRSRAEL